MRLHPTFYVGRLKEYHPSRPSFVYHSVNERDSLSQPSQPGSFPASSSEKDSLVEDLRPSSRDLVCGPPDQIVLSQQQELEMIENQTIPSLNPDSSESLADHHQGCRGKNQSDDQDAQLDQRESSSTQSGIESHCSPNNNLDESTYSHDVDNIRRDNSIPLFSDDRPGPPPLLDSHGNKRCAVEAIVDHKPHDETAKQSAFSDNLKSSRRLLRHYLVCLVSYQPEQDSWIPCRILEEDIPDILRDYDNRHNL
jgi:hypothetical protein